MCLVNKCFEKFIIFHPKKVTPGNPFRTHSVLSEPIALLLRITNKNRLLIEFDPKYYTFLETEEPKEIYGRHLYCLQG